MFEVGPPDMERDEASGYGKLTLADGTIKEGYWYRNKLVFDKSICELPSDFDYESLRDNEAKVKYKCGIR